MTATVPDGQYIIAFCSPENIDDDITFPDILRVVNPFEVTSHGEGAAVDVAAPVVSGTGSPGSTVEARIGDDASLGSAVVEADGTWTLTLDGAPQGPVKVTFVQGEKTFDLDLVLVDESEGTPLIDPAVASAAGAAVLGLGALALYRRRANAIV